MPRSLLSPPRLPQSCSWSEPPRLKMRGVRYFEVAVLVILCQCGGLTRGLVRAKASSLARGIDLATTPRMNHRSRRGSTPAHRGHGRDDRTRATVASAAGSRRTSVPCAIVDHHDSIADGAADVDLGVSTDDADVDIAKPTGTVEHASSGQRTPPASASSGLRVYNCWRLVGGQWHVRQRWAGDRRISQLPGKDHVRRLRQPYHR